MTGTADDFRRRWLADTQARFRDLRTQAERALEQLDDARFFAALDDEANSPAVLVKHLAGNLRSRWTDFLTTDGEKPDRQRDQEFVLGEEDSREALLTRWSQAWEALTAALESLGPADLDSIVHVRGEPHSIEHAVHRQLVHTAYHVGQIVLLAKHARGPGWRTLSIPRGGSEAFNRRTRERFQGDESGMRDGGW